MTTMTPSMRVIGAQLRRLREEKLLSHRELAAKAGVSPTTLLNLETADTSNPQLRTIRKIAAALEVDPFDFVERD